jgi:hypothetical protein
VQQQKADPIRIVPVPRHQDVRGDRISAGHGAEQAGLRRVLIG